MDTLTVTEVVTTTQDYVNLYNGLMQVQHVQGLAFAKKVLENMETLERELKPLNDLLKPSPEFEAFAQRVRDEAKGDPKLTAELEATVPELIDERQKQVDAAQVMLASPMEIKMRKIYNGELPSQISAAQLKGIKMILQ